MNYDIESLKRKMLVKYPFFGSVVSNVEYKEDKDIGTAGTDGEVIYYNPEFLNNLTVDEQTFIMAHEVCHIAFNHPLRSEGKNPMLWNIATDGVINALLKNDGLTMIDGGIDIEDAINYNAEQLYEKLLKENEQQNQNSDGNSDSQNNDDSQENNEQSNQGQSGQDNNDSKQQNQNGAGNPDSQNNDDKQQEDNQDIGHDTHSMWKKAVEKNKNKNKENRNKEKESNQEQKEQENKNDEVSKKQEECEQMGEKESFKKNLEEKKEQLRKLKEELSKKASQAGSYSNGDVRNVNSIGTAKPLIDWRYLLKEAVKYDVDWSYKNSYIEDGVINATLEEKPFPETEIVLDTSGSINEELLKNFLRECKNILLQSKLKVGCFDTRFYGFEEIRTEQDIEKMKFKGGGGTNFNAAVNAFSRRVENKIVFTDGEANMPEKAIDAIWIVFGDRKINPRGGRVINITGEYLDRLYNYLNDNISKTR